MNLFTLLLISLGLSLDALAVAVASGFSSERLHIRHAFRMALAFGLFQACMPIVGWMAGTELKLLIADIDHWMAFGLLSAIGGKMIYESIKLREEEKTSNPFAPFTLLTLAIATSIDALAVGASLSFIGIDIMEPAIIIGCVTFILSFLGVYIGKHFGHIFESKLEIAGGIILIGIGIKILVEHLKAT